MEDRTLINEIEECSAPPIRLRKNVYKAFYSRIKELFYREVFKGEMWIYSDDTENAREHVNQILNAQQSLKGVAGDHSRVNRTYKRLEQMYLVKRVGMYTDIDSFIKLSLLNYIAIQNANKEVSGTTSGKCVPLLKKETEIYHESERKELIESIKTMTSVKKYMKETAQKPDGFALRRQFNNALSKYTNEWRRKLDTPTSNETATNEIRLN